MKTLLAGAALTGVFAITQTASALSGMSGQEYLKQPESYKVIWVRGFLDGNIWAGNQGDNCALEKVTVGAIVVDFDNYIKASNEPVGQRAARTFAPVEYVFWRYLRDHNCALGGGPR
jgi:hypothetical protein